MFEEILFEESLSKAVDAMLRSGVYRLNEIQEFFFDIADDDPASGLNPSTIAKEVKDLHVVHLRNLLNESRSWSKPTDNEKLESAFKELNQNGIRAIQNSGFEASDCGDIYAEIRGNSQWTGYCFYHNQDLVRAVCGGELMIRYSESSDHPSEEGNQRIAEQMIQIMKSNGLNPEWDGDPSKTITLSMTWQIPPKGF